MVASLAVALMAGFSGLSLTQGASRLPVPRRKLTVAMAALVLGGGIWSMHFVAMLGLRLPIYFYYDAVITLISALVAILVVGAALLLLHFQPRTPVSITVAGVIVGLGIAAMHYIGMAGMELCRPQYGAQGIVLSVLSSVALSVVAIWVAYGRRTHRQTLLGTAFFGGSVFVMHFVAMAQTGFVQAGPASAVGPALSNEVLALGVALAAFVISGAFLLTGVTFAAPAEGLTDVTAPTEPAEAPPQQALSAEAEAQPPADTETLAEGAITIPYEREGATRFAEIARIAAVRAEGRYTVLYTGSDTLFCPWSISDAERRLHPGPFLRTHRSYLVNPAFVTGFERRKDTGVCYFEGVPALDEVPVSRSRLPDVRAALGL